MRNSTKLLIGILIVLIISLIVYITYIFKENNSSIPENNVQNESIEENTVEFSNESNSIENTVTETNTITDNTTNSSNIENTVTTNTTKTQEPIGQEEQQSSEQSGTENPEQTAIEFAKEEWGETSSSYNFVVDNVEGSIYHIAVISNAITIAYMDVNLETGEVTEK